MSGTKKRMLIIVLSVFLVLAVIAVYSNDQAHAAGYAAKYMKIVKKYYKKYSNVNYKIMNIDGKGKKELLLTCHTGNYGSGSDFIIYKCKKGKVRKQFKMIQYGLEKIKFYKKTKTLVLRFRGHGGEVFEYYRLKKGKYKGIVEKARQSVAGGAEENTPWIYHTIDKKRSLVEISKSEFNGKLKGLLKGKKISTNAWKWKQMW